MRRDGRRAIGVLAAWSLVLASLAAPPPARACSGADPVEAGDLLRHPGAIVVVEVIGRLGRAEEPRSVVLGVRETLRGVTSSIIRLDRPRQASGVCHDVFTGRVGARMLLALAVRTSTGLVLDPAWLVANDDRLLPIYDPVVPWATLSEARQALATPPTTLPPEVPFTFEDTLWILRPLLSAALVLFGVALVGRRHARAIG
jgi:hypothetical protein